MRNSMRVIVFFNIKLRMIFNIFFNKNLHFIPFFSYINKSEMN